MPLSPRALATWLGDFERTKAPGILYLVRWRDNFANVPADDVRTRNAHRRKGDVSHVYPPGYDVRNCGTATLTLPQWRYIYVEGHLSMIDAVDVILPESHLSGDKEREDFMPRTHYLSDSRLPMRIRNAIAADDERLTPIWKITPTEFDTAKRAKARITRG